MDSIGQMTMTPVVKYSLTTLRLYLLFMIGLVFYRVLSSIFKF
jgi:hypothetical protein